MLIPLWESTEGKGRENGREGGVVGKKEGREKRYECPGGHVKGDDLQFLLVECLSSAE